MICFSLFFFFLFFCVYNNFSNVVKLFLLLICLMKGKFINMMFVFHRINWKRTELELNDYTKESKRLMKGGKGMFMVKAICKHKK